MKENKGNDWVYMLRTTQQHQVQLSAIADQKANIIIASNCILLSLTLSRIESVYQYWGIWTLVGMSVLCIITSVIVIAPLSLKQMPTDTKSPNFNPLFFMHFTTLSQNEFQSEIKSIMQSSELIQDTMVKDIYQIGKVLATRKYPFLKLSSAIFILGLLTSLLLLIIQFSSL